MSANKIDEIFWDAAQIASLDERLRFLDQVCGNDFGLRRRVEELLAVRSRAEELFEPPVAGRQATVDQPVTEEPGTVIGPYKLLEQIGEGGFGIVYMADQQAPVRRRVGLKIIKPGMDTRQVLARFKAELQALSLMDHPNIARALDAGSTDSGRPYFVMELVRGVPITDYCDQNNLPVHARLDLFVQVCHAVQHAHQKGIIHRDIKPSNVLVTLHDGRPVPKVIDFGVAKAIDRQLTPETLFTRFAEMIGTPLYMSPEQAEMTGLDIDTRSDVYSLGVLLYELLTGSTPFEKDRLRQAAYDEIRRIIREEEPPKPSLRLSSLGDTRTAVAAHRQIDPHRLSQLVQGDLDWIVMKALEKDRTHRYDTASNFAADVLRYLSDQPVEARPPSAVYRFSKFARRNKGVLTTAVLLAAALVVTVVILAVSNVIVTREKDQKTQALADKEMALQNESAARAKANEQEELAKQSQEIADREAVRAREQEHDARRNLYAARISMADRNLVEGETGYALALLEAERSAADREDLRGFEWYHLWWRCHRGHRLTLRSHRGSVNSVVFSPDGKSLASGSFDGTVKLWDVATGKVRMSLNGHSASVTCVAFSPDGKTVASGSVDWTAKLWDVATGRQQATLRSHRDVVKAVAFSPDGALFATGSTDGTAKIWDIAARKERTNLRVGVPRTYNSDVQSVIFPPDGKTLAVGRDDGVQLWDVATGKNRSTLWGRDRLGIRSVVLSPDGKTLASGGTDGVKLLDLETGQERASLAGPAREVFCVAFSPDGKSVGLGTLYGTVVLWNPSTGEKRVYGHTGRVRSVAFSPDGKTLASGSEDQTVKLWDVATPQRPTTLPVVKEGYLWSVAFSPDSKTAAIAGDNGVVKLWDVAAMQPLGSLQGHTSNVICVAFAPDGKTLASGGDDKTIRLWHLSTWQEQALLTGNAGSVYCVAFSPDGKTLASGGTDGSDGVVKLWDVASRQQRATLEAHRWVWAVAFSPDGKTVASGCDDSSVKLWDATTGRERLTLRGHQGEVRAVAFSRDGRTLFSTDYRTLRFWDVATGQQQGPFQAREPLAPNTCVAALVDGKTLVIGSEAAVKFCDVAARVERATLKADSRHISSVAISPDGKILATTSFDGSAQFWPTATEHEVLGQSSREAVTLLGITSSAVKSASETPRDVEAR